MAGNYEDNESWAWNKVGGGEFNSPSAASASVFQEAAIHQSPGAAGGRRTSPRERVNPFLSRPYSDGGDAPLGTSSTQLETTGIQDKAASTQPETPCTQPEALGSQKLTSDSQLSSPDTKPPTHGTQQANLSSCTEVLAVISQHSMASAGTEPSSLTSAAYTPARPAESSCHSSPGLSVAAVDPVHGGITSDFIGLASPVDAATEPLPALDPYASHSPPTSEQHEPEPSSPAHDTHGLASPPPPAGAPYGLSAPSGGPYGAGAWPAGPVSSGDEDWERRPPAERWAPLGANDADDEGDDGDYGPAADSRRSSLSSADLSRLRKLEEEQEHLNNSLMALTTHFAQVQFRLRQIVEAPTEEKEQLLQELEVFAFRGIPDVRQYKLAEDEEEELTNEWKHHEMVETQRIKQRDLMQQLKTQLEDLEHYAYETGEAGLPSSVVLEKQRVIIDELKGKLNIDIDNLDRMTSEDLKSLVDCAVGQLINPLKMKEQLVNQLKTQVQDLERFISFLQGETEEGCCDGSCRRSGGGGGALSTSGDESGAAGDAAGHRPRLRRRSSRHHRPGKQQDVHEETSSMMKRALTLLQLVTLTQFGCGAHSHRFSSNELKKTPRGNHWGDLRARLELAVSAVSELAKESLREQQEVSDRGTDESDTAGPPAACGDRLTLAVRRELAVALRDLIQHGLLQMSRSRSVVPFSGCLPSRQSAPRLLHAWDLVLVYYRLKRGAQFNATPQRRLSQSFGLSVVGGTAITSKHTLLSAIGNIISSHTPLKRSADAHFKAFVCAGLNARKLSSWLRLVLTTQAITEEYYQPWSYVVSTGFDDALQCVARLEKMRFQLPEDLAVRQLRNIRDAF